MRRSLEIEQKPPYVPNNQQSLDVRVIASACTVQLLLVSDGFDGEKKGRFYFICTNVLHIYPNKETVSCSKQCFI